MLSLIPTNLALTSVHTRSSAAVPYFCIVIYIYAYAYEYVFVVIYYTVELLPFERTRIHIDMYVMV